MSNRFGTARNSFTYALNNSRVDAVLLDAVAIAAVYAVDKVYLGLKAIEKTMFFNLIGKADSEIRRERIGCHAVASDFQ